MVLNQNKRVRKAGGIVQSAHLDMSMYWAYEFDTRRSMEFREGSNENDQISVPRIL